MKIKQSCLNINKNTTETAFIKVADEGYFINDKQDDEKALSKDNVIFLVNNIDKLDMNEHIEIYKLLRMHSISADFFSKTNKGVYFDFSKLSKDLQWKIYNMVYMSIENIARTKIYNICTEEHNKHTSYPISS